MEPDEFIDIELRPALEVSRRCLALSALVQREALSADDIGDAEDDRHAAAFDLREWLRIENLWEALTPAEAKFLNDPVGRAVPDAFDTLYFGESLLALAWTLGLLPSLEPHLIPNYLELIDALPTPWEATSSWIASQRLRPELEIATERERAEVWEWRMAIELERRAAAGDDAGHILTAISEITREVERSGLLQSGNIQDHNELWHSIGELADEAIASYRMQFEHRLRALNWICGFGKTWDDVPLDV